MATMLPSNAPLRGASHIDSVVTGPPRFARLAHNVVLLSYVLFVG
jgi:hypothetical protein